MGDVFVPDSAIDRYFVLLLAFLLSFMRDPVLRTSFLRKDLGESPPRDPGQTGGAADQRLLNTYLYIRGRDRGCFFYLFLLMND